MKKERIQTMIIIIVLVVYSVIAMKFGNSYNTKIKGDMHYGEQNWKKQKMV